MLKLHVMKLLIYLLEHFIQFGCLTQKNQTQYNLSFRLDKTAHPNLISTHFSPSVLDTHFRKVLQSIYTI